MTNRLERDQRSRKPHTRSREGCTMCRKRHKRCGIERPQCHRCKSRNEVCVYPDVSIPLREQRAVETQQSALPGVLNVWAASVKLQKSYSSTSIPLYRAPAAGIDPFNSLSINMPLKSIPLLRYFFDASATLDSKGLGWNGKEGMSRTLHDQVALRSCILLAGLHYSWTTGSLSQFESTFLHHKIENIRLINDRLHDASQEAFFDCARQIATLALVEACLGNVQVAEVHLTGLLAFHEGRSPNQSFDWPGQDGKGDSVLDRYLLLCSAYVSGLKSLVHDVVSNGKGGGTSEGFKSHESENAVARLHGRDVGGISTRLNVICMLPQFLTSPTPADDVEPNPIMVNAQIESMRALTESMVLREQAVELDQSSSVWSNVWMEGAPTRLMYIWAESHAESIMPHSGDLCKGKLSSSKTLSSWCGMHAATSMYRNSVINFSNAGQVLSTEILRYISLTLEKDLGESESDIDFFVWSCQCNLWFWKAFVGLFCLTYSQQRSPIFKGLVDLRARFEQRVRSWALPSGIVAWHDARKILESVIWPSTSDKEHLAQFLWTRVISWDEKESKQPTSKSQHTTDTE